MARIEEVSSDDDDEAQEQQRRKQAAMPKGNFNDILQKASELKAAQMKDKRRAWEATPEFMKNTMSYDKDEKYIEMRKTASVAEKIEVGEPAKAEGNELYAQGKYVQAMTKYTEAVAVFRYWNREMVGKDQNLVCYKDDEKCQGGDKQKAQKFICSVLLNAAACMIKMQTPASPREVVWTCTEVLELDKSCVKAYYRRAMAYVATDSSHTLELAVKDLTKAAQLAPGDKDVRVALKKYRAEYSVQNAKDKKTYGGMFASNEGLYSKKEQEEMKKAPPPREDKATNDISDAELRARAKAMGIDLDNPKVHKEMEGRARARHEEEMKKKADELGIDLSDPDVQKALELLEKERKMKEAGYDPETPLPTWRKYLVYAFDKNKIFNLQNAIYAVLARLVNCFHDCYHCMNVRKDSLKARYGGHGLMYGFVAYMLATFASKIVGAAWSMSVPTSGDLTSPRVLDACACWFLVCILTPTRTVWSVYGNGRDSTVARGVLFSGEALNKFKSMTRGVLRSEPSGTLERLFLVATCGAASALSRALTDRYVVSDKPTSSWLMSAFSTMSNEVRKNLVVATVVFIAHDGKSIARVVEYLRCDTDDDFTSGVVGMMKRSYCVVTPENHGQTVELARQSVHLLVFVYILSVFLGKSAKPTAFKTKPPPKKAPAAPAVKKVQQKNNARRRAQQSGGGGNEAAKKTNKKKTKTE